MSALRNVLYGEHYAVLKSLALAPRGMLIGDLRFQMHVCAGLGLMLEVGQLLKTLRAAGFVKIKNNWVTITLKGKDRYFNYLARSGAGHTIQFDADIKKISHIIHGICVWRDDKMLAVVPFIMLKNISESLRIMSLASGCRLSINLDADMVGVRYGMRIEAMIPLSCVSLITRGENIIYKKSR